MYHHLRGDLCDLTPTTAVVEAGGVGFDLRIPISTYERLKGKKEARLFTHLHVREDELRLFGFATTGERDLFRMLLSVTGVGPSIAVAALSALSPADVARSISTGDLKTLQRIKGVGRKLAERLALELRDRVGVILVELGVGGSTAPAPPESVPSRLEALAVPDIADAVLALVGLGFDRKTAQERVLEKLEAIQKSGRRADAETLIKDCLRSG